MTVFSIIFLVILVVSFAGIAASMRRLFSYMALGKPDNRFDKPIKRLKRTFTIAFLETKLLRDPVAGALHLGIFWGFVVLLFAVIETIGEGLFHGFSLSGMGWLYSVITCSQDFFCLIVAFAVALAFWRRTVKKVKRLQVDEEHQLDATLILLMILIVVSSYLLQSAAQISIFGMRPHAVRPVARLLSGMLFGDNSFTVASYQILWWIHILAVLGFMNYLPFSKHLHVITSIPNVYFSWRSKPVPLKPINFEEEGVEKFGAGEFFDFTWKQLLDAYTCTECGRCTSVCPANQTGKELNPKIIITAIRDRMMDFAPIALAGNQESGQSGSAAEKKFIGGYESEAAIWACTTCGACMEECPVTIEHIPAIVDMRRNLVMMESRFPDELQATFRNLENNFTPWAFPSGERAHWAEGKNIVTMAENPNDYDVLFWVGCAGSFDARYKSVTAAFSELMNIAGVRYRILGMEEKCTGDPARRAGNEYLAQMLMKDNIETLGRYGVRKIVTTCPHCFNILLNEYPQFGGKYEVIHHTTFIETLIREGRLKPLTSIMQDIVYHDPCYLGRHNNEYDAPRNDIRRIPGAHLTEMGRNRDKSFCCGAGGARMFMEETEGKRVNIERTEEALATGATTIAAACPFCMTMMTDGVKAKNKIESVAVKDIAELILESVRVKPAGDPVPFA